MASEQWLVPTIAAVLGGGLTTGFAALVNAFHTGRQIKLQQEKNPADIDAVLLGGASQAVQVLTNSLTWTEGRLKALQEEQALDKVRIETLVESNRAKDVKMAEMETELRHLRVQVAEVQTALDRAQTRINEMRGFGNGQE